MNSWSRILRIFISGLNQFLRVMECALCLLTVLFLLSNPPFHPQTKWQKIGLEVLILFHPSLPLSPQTCNNR